MAKSGVMNQQTIQANQPFRRHWARRVLRGLAACIVLLVFIQIRGCYHQEVINSYLKNTSGYMTYEKDRTGQWPRDLRGYQQYCKRLGGWEDGFHRNEYLGMKIIKKDKEWCLYMVILKEGEFQVDTAA